jgi:acetolactate decarboxylase
LRNAYLIFIILLIALTLSGCSRPVQQDRETMYQASTFNALAQGVYDGEMTISTLKQHGDTGIGTFTGLDGEMIVLDGVVYQAKSDGSIVPAGDNATSPLAMVTFFDADMSVPVAAQPSLKAYMDALNGSLDNKNAMYAIKAHGHFDHVKVRSVPAQQRPYPVLTEAVKNQTVFDFDEVNGTIVGLWFPEYMAGVNVAGYHFHFISDDRMKGGHMLDCSSGNLTFDIDETGSFAMVLPSGVDFARAEIGKTNASAVAAIEK